MNLELLVAGEETATRPAPLVLVHGAWHGAWCWQEHFVPALTEAGYAVYAVSLRGHGASAGRGRLRWTRLADYVADVADVTAGLPAAPVLVGHSMGGLVVQKYLEQGRAAAGVLLASAPPRGITGAVLRTARHDPLGLLRANLTLSLYPLVSTPEKARDRLFSDDTPTETVIACYPRLQDESFRAFLDMIVLDLPRPERVNVPVLVLGAAEDGIFSPAEVTATARAYHTQATLFPNMGHNMMLEPGWERVVATMVAWLGEQGL